MPSHRDNSTLLSASLVSVGRCGNGLPLCVATRVVGVGCTMTRLLKRLKSKGLGTEVGIRSPIANSSRCIQDRARSSRRDAIGAGGASNGTASRAGAMGGHEERCGLVGTPRRVSCMAILRISASRVRGNRAKEVRALLTLMKLTQCATVCDGSEGHQIDSFPDEPGALGGGREQLNFGRTKRITLRRCATSGLILSPHQKREPRPAPREIWTDHLRVVRPENRV